MESSEPIKFFGGEYRVISITEICAYSKTCALMIVELIERDIYQNIPMIFYQDSGIIFCPKDWQSIPADFSREDVESINWVFLNNGKDAVMLQGLPHIPPFL